VKNNVFIDNHPAQSAKVKTREVDTQEVNTHVDAVYVPKDPPLTIDDDLDEKSLISKLGGSSSKLTRIEKRDRPHRIETVELLQSLLDLYTSNVLKDLEGELILKNSDLVELIMKITEADDVEVKLDYEINCCGGGKGLNVIDRINIIKDEEVTDFQHFHNVAYNILRKYKISLSMTHD
jgi:hypothetical protein